MMNEMKQTAAILQDGLLGLIGITAPLMGVVASWQEQMEWGMRMLSLGVGVAVGVVTIISLRRRSK
ncbi:hypothetical protein EI77_04294 [Prosthecobacter fusiformis]|uniref:Uncharacterized protein n=1 Tax=Prosthecobacter fusiformis TaxID=48464 RepID=A0A4V3FE14_9BACT|nr:hypothetical protein [Prosthecobacter fusiformis]TDU64110.1 hypothetical protein EI77_04294 [Prosthecobacter fusiformis]